MARKKKAAEEPKMNLPMTAEGRYDSLSSLREPYLMRARDCSKLTIPSLVPPLGATGSTIFYTPFQSVGAEGVKNLASKLLLALFPPGSTFFRLTMDDFVVEALEAKAGQGQEGDARTKFEEALAKVERAVVNRMEQMGARTALFEALKHLIVAGNVLLYVGKKGAIQYYRLDKYVVKRDVEGNVLDIVVKDVLSYATLPDKVRAIVDSDETTKNEDKTGENTINVFTRTTRCDNKWESYQEVCGIRVEGSEETYPLDNSRYIAARYSRVDGEDYGRGHCEEFIGDLQSTEALARSIVEFAGAASKILFFVSEGGTTNKRRAARAPSGAFLDGNAKDISVLQLEKFQDFNVVKQTYDTLVKRLERAFLLLAGSQRDAERVTAEEIRLIAQELESALGGVYSILAQEVQRPLASRVLLEMQKEGRLPPLPKQAVSPQIITGLEALGRGSDLAKLDQLITGIAQEFGQEAVAKYLNISVVIQRRATALSVPIDGIVRSDQEVQASEAQAQQAALQQKTAPVALKAQADLQQRALEKSGSAAPGVEQ